MFSGEFAASLTMEIAPATLPAAVGANDVVRIAISEGLSVAGATNPVVVMPAPVVLMLVIFNDGVPGVRYLNLFIQRRARCNGPETHTRRIRAQLTGWRGRAAAAQRNNNCRIVGIIARDA